MSGWPIEILQSAGPLLILAVVILVGVACGSVARRLRLPRVTGQILGGVLIGRAGLDAFGEQSLADLEPLTHFALGLIAVTVGAHLNVRRLRNAGRRLFLLLLTESTVLPLIVFCALVGLSRIPTELAILLAAVSIATAPATTIAIVRETRSKGVFVKTLIAAVALNNMACIVLFEVARSMAAVGPGDASSEWGGPAGQLLLAAGIGTGIALCMDLVTRLVVRPDRLTTAAVVALVLASGLASTLGVSPLLACLLRLRGKQLPFQGRLQLSRGNPLRPQSGTPGQALGALRDRALQGGGCHSSGGRQLRPCLRGAPDHAARGNTGRPARRLGEVAGLGSQAVQAQAVARIG